MQEVLTIPAADGARRVVIFRRTAGTFGFEEQRFSDDPLEQRWGRYSQCFCPTAEAALLEAMSRVSWLASSGAETDD